MSTSSTRPLRVGVIGTGFGAQVHVPAFRASDDFEVVAIASRQLANAERVAREANVGWYSDDYRRMLAEVDLDVVSISTPGGLHHEMVLAAAQAGRDILCEKPFATNITQAQEMVAAVKQAGVRHAINHEFRMIPARRALRDRVQQGFLGTVFDVRGINDSAMLLNPNRRWNWWSDRQQEGGIMQAMTSHLIDYLLWTFGDIEAVSAQVDTYIRERPDDSGTVRPVTSDDQNAALLRFANGAAGLLHVSGLFRAPRAALEAHGSTGSLIVEGEKLLQAQEPGKLEEVSLSPLPPVGTDNRVTLMANFLPHVARVLRGESDDLVATFEQGVRVQAVMDALHASSEQGGTRVEVRVPATV